MNQASISLLLLATIFITNTERHLALASSADISKQLTERLKTYDKRVRPYHNVSAVNVSVKLGVIGLGPVDEKSLTLGLDFYLRHWWRDERLDFGNEAFNFNGDPSDTIWVPDTFFPNAVDIKHHKTLTPSARTIIGPNGTVYTSIRLTLKTFCKMHLSNYPFDKQICKVVLESYAFTGREMSLSWKDAKIPVEYFSEHVQLSGYDLVSIHGETDVTIFDNGEKFVSLVAAVNVKRTFTYHLFSGYMPTTLLVILTWATFWIPPKAVPARVTLIVTNFLSTIFVIQQEGLKITRVDYTTAIQIFLMTNLVFVMLSMVEYLIVLNTPPKVKKKKKVIVIANGLADSLPNGDQEQKEGKQLEARTIAQRCDKNYYYDDVHFVDYYSRLIVPLLYAAFVAAYIGYFVNKT
ncbi:gamma-aminobutyric acid receptor subunit rho-1-like isoform X2 [Rhopilema esculentum]